MGVYFKGKKQEILYIFIEQSTNHCMETEIYLLNRKIAVRSPPERHVIFSDTDT